MKAIVVGIGIDGTDIREVRVATDSTLLRTGEPLFVADHLGEWTCAVCPAVRISRLGTNISQKAAGRYFDTVLLAGVVSPQRADMLPAGAIGLLDRSIAPGDGMGAECLTDEPAELTIKYATDSRHYRVSGLRRRFESIIHELSRYCTFKTGDLVVLSGPESIEIEPDTEIHAELSTGPRLHLRLK